jgi:protein phosphatase 1 regulatory subunit 37
MVTRVGTGHVTLNLDCLAGSNSLPARRATSIVHRQRQRTGNGHTTTTSTFTSHQLAHLASHLLAGEFTMADVEAVPTPSEPLVVSTGVTEADPSTGVAAESSDQPAQPTPSTQPDSNPAEAVSPRAPISSQPDRPSSRSSSKATATAAASTSAPTPSPARRRPKPPTKGILKPPPPPAKPTLGNRLRDLASTVVSGSSKLFDADDPSSSSPRGGVTGSPATSPPSVSAAVGGTLNAISGRLGLGLSRFVAGTPSPSPGASPAGSPAPSRTALPETGAGSGSPQPHPQSAIVARQQPMSERSRQKQPLKRATFVLPSLSITYPISSSGEPWSIKVIEDRKRVRREYDYHA